MTRRAWVRLDNASNIFLAARSEVDPKVFRLSAEMDHDVDPAVLQEALDETFDHYPLYHAVLRRGAFWYYLQDSGLRPTVRADTEPSCAPLYREDRRELLFRVRHRHRRIVLEVFHALSDGTGALWFLSDLVTAYVRRRRELEESGGAPARPAAPARDASAPVRETEEHAPAGHGRSLMGDSFARYFHRRRGEDMPEEEAFVRAAASAVPVEEPAPTPSRVVGRGPRRHETLVHRARGTRTPDSRTRAVELTMPVADVLARAKAEQVGATLYITALFFEALRRCAGDLGRSRTLAASIPVNLRQFFPSGSARNFFTAIRVEHTFGEGPDDLGDIGRSLEADFRPQITAEALEARLRRLSGLERSPLLRVVPRPLKDLLLGLANRINNRALTVSVSNLGRVQLPEDVDGQVQRLFFHVSAVRPQICAISHGRWLTISFTSPFQDTDHIREFARLLSGQGIDVRVAAARVSEAELAEGAV